MVIRSAVWGGRCIRGSWLISVLAWPLMLCVSACTGTIGEGPPQADKTFLKPPAPTSGSGAAGEGGATGEGGEGPIDWKPVETEWCAEGWTGLDDHTCFYAPEKAQAPVSVLYFLHGMMPPDSTPKGMENIARAAADAYGFIAVVPRGRQGLCAWHSSVEEYWCWPTSRQTVDESAADILDEWGLSQTLLEAVLGTTFARRYVVGFSNGGYFASYIGLEGLLSTDGIGVVSAGRSFIDESLMPPESTPFYIAVGELETQDVQNGAENLATVLTSNAWPNDFIIHQNQGHTVTAADFDGAVVAWGF